MNTKRSFIITLSLVTAIFVCALRADAAITVTVNNNRSHALSLSFCWAGFDYDDDVSKGWYVVKAGETRKITLKDVQYHFTAESFGYYAKGTPKGEKTIYWRGKDDDSEYMAFYIHQSEAFTGSHDNPIKGGQKVHFRHMKLKETGNSRTDGSATLTFNP